MPARRPLQISLAGERLLALPERALFWPSRGILFAADLHLGRPALFARHGVMLPAAADHGERRSLAAILGLHPVKTIVLLGDTLDAPGVADSPVLESFRAWKRASVPDIRFACVPGNHDRRARRDLENLGFELLDDGVRFGPFLPRHHPAPADRAHVLCGHIHPGARLGGPARTRLRLPCFHLRPQLTVLPAFGRLTGLAPIRPEPADRVLVVADSEVIEIPTHQAR